MNTRRPILLSLATLAFALQPIAGRAERLEITEMFVFGDSLSDGGNAGLITQAFAGTVFPPAPYAGGRFSNGPTAVEYLWSQLGIAGALLPSLAGGTNFAVGGATTGTESFNEVNPRTPEALRPAFDGTSASAQLEAFQAYASSTPFDPATSLFVVWLFPNDVFYAGTTGALPGVVPGSPGGDNVVSNGIANILSIIQILAAAGAENFLVLNLPDPGDTPEFSGTPEAAALSALTSAFNAALAAQLDLIADALDINLVQFFIDQLFEEMLSDPAAFGFANAAQPCIENLSNGLCNPDEWVFWDGAHPTTRAHQIIADRISRVFIAEPGTLVLLGLGLILLAWVVRRSAN
jgi:phospholipase/lecithinase/hemolysin